MDLLNELSDLYSHFKSEVNIPIELQSRLSAPLLLHPTNRWKESDKRVLIVGQEGEGWGVGGDHDVSPEWPLIYSFEDFLRENDSVIALMSGYKDWEFALPRPKTYGSPFWQAYRRIRKNFDENVDGTETAVLWNNLFPMSLDDGSVYHKSTDEEWETIQRETKGKLSAEIKILQPNAVVFFTGPYYDSMLINEFEGVELRQFDGYEKRQAAWLNHPSLPSTSLRTYHPNHLSWKLPELLDAVEEAIVAGLNQ